MNPAAVNLPVEGARLYPGYLDPETRRALLADVLARTAAAPFYTAAMPRTGAPLSTQTTNLGPLGWVTDIAGYRYQAAHPHTGAAWPAMPPALLDLWRDVADYPAPPEACLVNWYGPASRLGLHVDQDEEAVNAPVVSVSLGDDALFRLGGLSRRDPTRSLRLRSGDVIVLAGTARRCFHGVDRIYPGTSQLVPGGGRINLTMRRVSWP